MSYFHFLNNMLVLGLLRPTGAYDLDAEKSVFCGPILKGIMERLNIHYITEQYFQNQVYFFGRKLKLKHFYRRCLCKVTKNYDSSFCVYLQQLESVTSFEILEYFTLKSKPN